MDFTSIRETKGFEMQTKGIHIPHKRALAFLLVKSTLLDIHIISSFKRQIIILFYLTLCKSFSIQGCHGFFPLTTERRKKYVN